MLPGGWLFPGQNPVNPLTTRQPGRLRISVSQAFQLRPEPLPGSGEGLADYHGDAAAVGDDPGGSAQDALAEAAQASPFPGRRLNHILTARNGHRNWYFFTDRPVSSDSCASPRQSYRFGLSALNVIREWATARMGNVDSVIMWFGG